MEVRIQSIHFDASDRLVDFINKKAARLNRHNTAISVIDFTLKVVKPETAMNKDVVIKVSVPAHDDIHASKTADSFEEAIDLCIDALEKQLEKKKERKA